MPIRNANANPNEHAHTADNRSAEPVFAPATQPRRGDASRPRPLFHRRHRASGPVALFNFMFHLAIAAVATCAASASIAGIDPSTPASTSASAPAVPHAGRGPTALAQLEYARSLWPADVTFDASITPPDALLQHGLGRHPASHAEIDRCLVVWSEESPRAERIEYAVSHQGRPLSVLVISSPENMARLDAIADAQQQLADPRRLAEADADALLQDTPAVAWLGYGIHGDEASGPDAALAAAYFLIAGQDAFVQELLEKAVIIIDPALNPDGRERFLNDVRQALSAVPDVDDQSRMNHDRWPSGRMNHYLFDLNRDWIFATQPETAGRIRLFNRWYPQLFIDAHEMGAQETYFFTPSAEPINPHYPTFGRTWWERFALDHTRAFDAEGWPYYTTDIFDDWYPGYSNSWAAYRGSVGILYEQAGVVWHGIVRPEGRVLTYPQTVHQQFVSTLTNLRTLLQEVRSLKEEWLAARREAITPPVGRPGDRVWAVRVDAANPARRNRLLELLELQRIEAHALTAPLRAPGVDRFGRASDTIDLPAGTLLIAQRQPEAPMVAALFEFDTPFDAAFLAEEREEVVRRNSTRMYDITAWSIPLLLDLEAWDIAAEIPTSAVRVLPAESAPAPGRPSNTGAIKEDARNALSTADDEGNEIGIDRRDARQGWVIDGTDDRVPALAAKLLDAGVRVRVALRAFAWGSDESPATFPRGSLIITREDHRHLGQDSYVDALHTLTREEGLRAHGLDSGYGPGSGRDLGGRYFPLLHPVRIAVIGGDGVDPYDFGSIWHLLDHVHALPAAWLDSSRVRRSDLDRYDVIVVPAGATRNAPADVLLDWAENGGTLVAIGASAAAFARETERVSARLLPDVLEEIEPYQVAMLREVVGSALPSLAEIHSRVLTKEASTSYPWAEVALGNGDADGDELRRRDSWDAQFSPSGAILAARVDDEHWLTFGLGKELPVLAGAAGSHVLMAAEGVEAPIRFGIIEPAGRPAPRNKPQNDAGGEQPAAPASEGHGAEPRTTANANASAPRVGEEREDDETKAEGVRVGWSVLPPATSLRLRAAGLLWPEAARRLANSAVVTRESIGRGQLILMSPSPAFRGTTPALERVFLNAVIFGPGLESPPPLRRP